MPRVRRAHARRHLALSTNNIEKISSLAGMDALKILSLGRNLIKKASCPAALRPRHAACPAAVAGRGRRVVRAGTARGDSTVRMHCLLCCATARAD